MIVSPRRLASCLPVLLLVVLPCAQAVDSTWVGEQAGLGAFPLVTGNQPAAIAIAPEDFPVVSIAAGDLAADIERVTGAKPPVTFRPAGPAVLIGTLGRSPLIDGLVAAGKLEVKDLRGAWESYAITTVANPLPGVPQALVIVGSDRRGTAFGIYELSQAIGVSPWYWWADVTPARKTALFVAAGTRRFGPPSVKYRGIFINDEDWGLQPWAAKTFEPESGDIGPKTYAKVFELLLRLRANTLWPAMHPSTHAFNHFADNKRVADAYGIVMGSSHAEPMLRNNVSEWTAPAADYNYVTNRAGVLKYWDERVAANGAYENIYTLGMRGIHDSNMQGPRTDAERIQTLERIFVDQRALLARHVRLEVEQVPQMFCAYKEVLDLYRQGLRVPEDVTIVWPDDNFGYIRNFASAAERKRPGGFGVYYHLSYLGAPLSYLWLGTTPPALIWEEMHKAYEQGADRIWIANVGDLKPSEVPLEFFLQLAWDAKRWRPDNLAQFLSEWATRDIGPDQAAETGAILAEYYRLNFQRKPEHLQWWLPRQPRRASPLTDAEVEARLAAFAQLRARTEALRVEVPAARRDAFDQLVYYPVVGSALMNERFFAGERGDLAAAQAADRGLVQATHFYNESISGGKWRGLMKLEPADGQWSSMRLEPWSAPAAARVSVAAPAAGTYVSIAAADFTASVNREGAAWTEIPGLGRTGRAVTVLPTTTAPVELAVAETRAARLDYAVTLPAAGEVALQLYLLPTHPLAGSLLRLGAALDDAPPQMVTLDVADGGPAWAQGVLDATRLASVRLRVTAPGAHVLRLYGLEPGVVLDKVVIDLGGLTSTYLGPPEK